MAELTPQERLQPALLDRLIDDEPDRKVEPIERRVINKARLRQAVLRDLEWLLNCTCPNDSKALKGAPLVAKSVINFGLPALAGTTVSELDIVELERIVKLAIHNFEPRIDAKTLEVQAIVAGDFLNRHNVVTLEIRGILWAQPAAIELLLRTELDLETGDVSVHDVGRAT